MGGGATRGLLVTAPHHRASQLLPSTGGLHLHHILQRLMYQFTNTLPIQRYGCVGAIYFRVPFLPLPVTLPHYMANTPVPDTWNACFLQLLVVTNDIHIS